MARHNVGKSIPYKGKFSNDDAIVIRRTVSLPQGKNWKFEGISVSIVRVVKTFAKMGVGIGRTGPEGRLLTARGHEPPVHHVKYRLQAAGCNKG